ncbi:MAG TPA: hypothetical protein VFG32_02770 [Bacteroidota bacterium]|nr:hypothetical protein [Bacteroidota bacterium]
MTVFFFRHPSNRSSTRRWIIGIGINCPNDDTFMLICAPYNWLVASAN